MLVFKDDNGKSRSLSLKQINDGECGGWDALIPENSTVPKGKRIFDLQIKKYTGVTLKNLWRKSIYL